MSEFLSGYQCSFCPTEETQACFACGKRFCREHGAGDGVGATPRCQECFGVSLAPIGDTYQFTLPSGQVIEDISTIEDRDLHQLLDMYSMKVKELETLLISAKAQQRVLQRRLKLIPGEVGKVLAAAPGVKSKIAKVPKPLGKDDLAALADLLFQSGKAKDIIEKLGEAKK